MVWRDVGGGGGDGKRNHSDASYSDSAHEQTKEKRNEREPKRCNVPHRRMRKAGARRLEKRRECGSGSGERFLFVDIVEKDGEGETRREESESDVMERVGMLVVAIGPACGAMCVPSRRKHRGHTGRRRVRAIQEHRIRLYNAACVLTRVRSHLCFQTLVSAPRVARCAPSLLVYRITARPICESFADIYVAGC